MKHLSQGKIGITLCVVTVLLYICQFVIVPLCFPSCFPESTTANIVLIVPPLIIALVVTILLRVKLWMWALIDFLYFLLMSIYNGRGLYGVGFVNITVENKVTSTYSAETAMVDVFIGILFLFVVHVIFTTIKNKIVPPLPVEY